MTMNGYDPDPSGSRVCGCSSRCIGSGTMEMVERVAKAIGKAQARGWNGPWSLARVAIAATLEGLPFHVKQSVEQEMQAKSKDRLTGYSAAAKKGWRTKRAKRLREAATSSAQEGKVAA